MKIPIAENIVTAKKLLSIVMWPWNINIARADAWAMSEATSLLDNSSVASIPLDNKTIVISTPAPPKRAAHIPANMQITTCTK